MAIRNSIFFGQLSSPKADINVQHQLRCVSGPLHAVVRLLAAEPANVSPNAVFVSQRRKTDTQFCTLGTPVRANASSTLSRKCAGIGGRSASILARSAVW